MNRARAVRLVVPVVVMVALGSAGCGSRIDPNQVAGGSLGGSNQAGGVAGSVDGTVGGSGAAVGTTAQGADASTDSGAATVAGDSGAGAGAGSGSTATGTSGGAAATSGVKASSCDGFANQTGITDSTITISNVSDISGPVPGLFQASQDAVKAFVAYFNATTPDGICGRKLNYLALDTREDAGGDQSAYAKSCEQAFAVVGSSSAFDAGGAATAEKCGIPDIRSNTLSNERGNCPVCYPTQSGAPDVAPDVGFKFYRSYNKAATDKAAFLYIDVAGSADQSDYLRKVAEKSGFTTIYKAGIDITEFNYAPYA